MSDSKEMLEIINEAGNVLGLGERSRIHSDPSLLHRVVHVLVFNPEGQLLLQKRSMNKEVAPGKWDTSVGGHVNPGEALRNAALREMEEELGIKGQEIDFLYTYVFKNHRESELVTTFSCIYEGVLQFNREEIDEVEFWGLKRIKANLGKGLFSGHFEKELENYLTRL